MCVCRIAEFIGNIMRSYFQDGKSWVSYKNRVKNMNDDDIKKMIKEIEEDHTEDFVKQRKIKMIH